MIFLVLLSHSVVSDFFKTPWTVAHQAPLSMGFSRQEYWGGLLFPSPGDLPDPGIKPASPALQVIHQGNPSIFYHQVKGPMGLRNGFYGV